MKWGRNIIKLIPLALIAFSYFAEGQTQSPRQKIYLFLSEPLREEVVTVKLENEIRQTKDPISENPQEMVPSPDYRIIYTNTEHTKNSITLELGRPGFVKLEVYDFYGKLLGTLFEGYSDKDLLVIEENESWKAFTQFRGISFFLVTLDGHVVLKKLLPKVE